MRYYRIALVAPMNYSPDDPVWNCFEFLRLEGHTVEVIDPRRFPGVLRDGAPDLAMLHSFLNRFKPDYLGDGHEGPEGILKSIEASGRRGHDKPSSRFVVFGFVGPNNFGDELIFSIICNQLEARFPNAHIQLIGHNPLATLSRHGVASITCEDKISADVMIRGARCLIYMAGVMFDDPFEQYSAGPVDLFLNPHSEIGGQTAFTVIASLYNVPAVYLGIGAGPLKNPDAQRLVRLEGRLGARYLPRDAETERLLLDAGVPANQVHTKADLAFLVQSSIDSLPSTGILGQLRLERNGFLVVSLREYRTVPEGFVPVVAHALTEIATHHELPIVLADLSPQDASIHEAIATNLSSSCRLLHVENDHPLGDFVELISSARATIAMRLHCSIVANACGIPSIAFDYNEKVGAFYQKMGRTDMLMPMDASADMIISAFDAIQQNAGNDSNRIAQNAQSCRNLANEAFGELVDLLSNLAAPDCPQRIFYPRSTSLEEVQRNQALEQLHLAEAEIHSLRSSTIWRVGQFATALPRALKRRLSAIHPTICS